MWVYDNGQFKLTKNAIEKKIGLCLQDLMLWKGESPFDVERGIDWTAILNGSKAIENEIDRVLLDYRQFFDKITISRLEKDKEKIIVDITFQVGDELTTKGVTLWN